jgi:5,10-methylenetetrahydromethanopterin reductase
MSRFGVAFDGRAPLGEIAAQAHAAEAGGASTLWFASHLFLRDPITMAATALAATGRVRVALMAMSPYSVHPVYIAMAAAALEELHPGRVSLCLGVGAPGDLAAAGIAAPKPLATLREAVAICRSLFAGETIRHDGEIFKVSGRSLASPPCDVPIVLAASGPKMLELAGEIADGVLISAATSVPFVRQCLAQADRRAGGRRFLRTGIVYTRIDENARRARDDIRRKLGFILRGPHHAKNIEASGAKLDREALWDAYAAEDWATVERLIGDDVVDRHAAAGDAADVRRRYAEYAAIGLDEIVVGGIDTSAGISAALAAVT